MTNRSLSILVLAVLAVGCGSPTAGGTGGSGGIAGAGGSGGVGGQGGTGGDDGSGGARSCEDQLARFSPCGGDVVGTWTISQVCTVPLTALGSLLTTICPVAMFSADPPTATGTWTFNGDGTLARDSTLALTGMVSLPDACLNALPSGGAGPAASCAALPSLASQAFPGIKLQCTYTSPACACSIDVSEARKDTVHYTVADGDVTITDDPSTPKAAYCIVGDEMTVEADQSVATQTVRAVMVLHR